MAWILFATVYTPSLDYYKEKLFKTAIMSVGLFLPFFFIDSKEDIKYIIPIINVIAFITASVYIYIYITEGSLDRILYDEEIVLKYPRYAGVSLTAAAGVVVNLTKNSPKFIAFKVYLLLGIILAGSRGPFALLLVMMMIYYLSNYIKSPKKLILFSVVLVTGMVLFLSWPGNERIMERFDIMKGGDEGDNTSVQLREEHWSKSSDIIGKHPILGAGYGSYGIVAFQTDDRYAPHNIFLEIFVETGIIGFLILGAFWWALFKVLFECYKSPDNTAAVYGLMTALVFYFCVSFFSIYFSDSKYLFGFVGMFLAVYNNELNSMQNQYILEDSLTSE
ncbi:O-antigen ligase family protein [Solitalea koreensis]|nr:O-antigen ligase family protein [Solitalea koreensis]